MKKTAAIYACSSSNDKRQRRGDLGGQIDACLMFAEKRNLQVATNLLYVDEVHSKPSDKKRLNDLFIDSEAKKFDVVLVENLQMLSINEIKILTTIIRLNYQGIKLVPVNDYSQYEDSLYDSMVDSLDIAA